MEGLKNQSKNQHVMEINMVETSSKIIPIPLSVTKQQNRNKKERERNVDLTILTPWNSRKRQ